MRRYRRGRPVLVPVRGCSLVGFTAANNTTRIPLEPKTGGTDDASGYIAPEAASGLTVMSIEVR